MMRPESIPFFRTEQIQDKILVEQALKEAEIEYEISAPGQMTTSAIYQERGPWEFYTSGDNLKEAEQLVRTLPADNLLTNPKDTPRTTTAQKSWAWMIIVIASAMMAVIAFQILRLQSR